MASISCSLAVRETLELLEWPLLCKNLATFASTDKGRLESENLVMPENLLTSKLLLKQTLEIGLLDNLLEGGVSFSGVSNLDRICSRAIKGAVINGEELIKVADTLAAARRLRKQIYDPTIRPNISSLLEDLVTLPDLEKLLRFGLEEGGRVADRASIKLSSLRQKFLELNVERKDLLNDILRRSPSIFQDSVIGIRYERPVLSIKVGLSSQLPGIVHDSSASGNTLFIEPQKVIPLGNIIASIKSKIHHEEQRILKEWSLEIARNHVSLLHLCDVILQIDLALTRARYGEFLDGVLPILEEEKDAPFCLKDLRHPLLVWKEHFQAGEKVVPVSLEVSSDLRVIAITGPNTGGKTVTLKSVGLAVLMARAGLLLPCSGKASLPWCEMVLADIGDEQSLQQSLSTFSGHLRRVNNILEAIKNSHGPTLVLLDEIGAGTDPSEGVALAIALLKTFAERARLTIATTHFGELKALKYSDSRFENASVSFDSETMSPTYHLQWGIPGRSNAIAIAKRLDLDSSVIDKAQELLTPLRGQEVDQMIIGLEEQRKLQQESAEKAAVLLARTEILHEELLIHWQKQIEYSERQKLVQRKNFSVTIESAQKEVRNLISRLRSKTATGETARLAGQRLRQLQEDVLQKASCNQSHNEGWVPKVGDRVRLIDLGKIAEVIYISDDGSQLTLLCGSFRSKVSLSSVESIKGEKPKLLKTVVKVNSKTTQSRGSKVRTTTNTLDVRGLRVHEAEVILEEFLRKTASPVWVVHGIGSGKLKRGLREWLKTLSYVERVIDAEQQDGGAGCSVIWLY